MWHNVGLTLLVFVATLLIVLLLMVCGEWGQRRGWSGKLAWASVRSGPLDGLRALGGHLASQDRVQILLRAGRPGITDESSANLQGWHPDSR